MGTEIIMTTLTLKGHEVVRFPTTMSDKEVRSTVKEETGFSVRRLDNVTLIALSAVDRLMKNNNTSKNLALYSAAEYMSVDLFQSVIIAMENNETIRPYDFIATVGNAANFYLTKEFAIHGPNIFIGASENALLKTSLLAEIDMVLEHCSQAIIVIWHINNKEWRCHALLIEQSTVTEEANTWHHPVTNSDELLTLAMDGEYPLSINLTCS
jgi:hypothetical protein